MATINQIIYDRSIANQINVVNFSRTNALKLANELNSNIEELKKEILLFLSNNDTSDQRTFLLKTDLKKLKSLENKLRKVREAQYTDIEAKTLDLIYAFMVLEKKTESDIIYGNWYDPILPTDQEDQNYFMLMMILGSTFTQGYKNLVSLDISRISKTLRYGISQNQSNTEILNSITGTAKNNNVDGVLNTSKNQLESFINSSIIAAQTAVINNLNSKNKLIMYGQFVAVLDARTSAICQANSGKVGKYSNLPHPPLHYNCRSKIAPFFKKIPGVPSNNLGNPPQKEDYKQWITRQPKSVQEQVLGVKRTELLRSGDISIDKFYSNTGLYTLKELSNRYKGISSSIN